MRVFKMTNLQMFIFAVVLLLAQTISLIVVAWLKGVDCVALFFLYIVVNLCITFSADYLKVVKG